jgi:5-formyltetrahydrofolate cyclo-ligase
MDPMETRTGPEDAKRSLRLAIRGRRLAQWRWLAAWRSRAMCARLLRVSAFRRARLVLGYAPVRGECDPGPALAAARRAGAVTALPRVAGPRLLAFHAVDGAGGLPRGAFGIPEPPADERTRVDPRDAEVVLVPGCAFSLTGDRLGAGGGFYDALLRRREGAAIGIGFELQVVAALPVEPHDIRLDALVTERRTRYFGTP